MGTKRSSSRRVEGRWQAVHAIFSGRGLLLLVALLAMACEPEQQGAARSGLSFTPPECTADAECGRGPCVEGACLVCETVDFDFDGAAKAIQPGENVASAYAPELSIGVLVNGRRAKPTALQHAQHGQHGQHGHSGQHPKDNALGVDDDSKGRRGHDAHKGKHRQHDAVFRFAFDHPTCVESLDVLGLIGRGSANVKLYDASGALLAEIVERASHRTKGQEIDLGAACGVTHIVVKVDTRVRLDNLKVCGQSAPLNRCSRVLPDGVAETFVPVSGPRGLLAISSMSDAPDPFSPEGDGIDDATVLSASAELSGRLRGRVLIPFTYQILDALSCAPIRSLRGLEQVGFDGEATLSSTWDGLDQRGRLAPDGVYLYRLFAESEKGVHEHKSWHHHGKRHQTKHDKRQQDAVKTGFKTVILDTTPLQVLLDEPRPEGQPLQVQWDARVSGTLLEIEGRVTPPRDLRNLDVLLNGAPITLSITPLGRFSASGMLNTAGMGPVIINPVSIVAQDDLGQIFTYDFSVRVRIDDVVPGLVLARFNPLASEQQIQDTAAAVGATIRRRDRQTREAVLAIDLAQDPRDVAVALAAQPAIVAYASPEGVAEADGLCDGNPATDDPARGTAGQYYLDNAGNVLAFARNGSRCRPGSVATDCAGAQDECIVGRCTQGNTNPARFSSTTAVACNTNADCQAAIGATSTCSSGSFCLSGAGVLTTTACTTDANCTGADPSATCVATGLCGRTSVANADFGWQDASANVCSINNNGPEVILANIEPGRVAGLASGVGNFLHRDLQSRVFTSFAECAGTACTADADCVTALGAGSTCIQNQMCDGPDADVLPDCLQGTAAGPTDGCPGLCGDDDGDGFADLADPEVQGLLERLNGNCLDDDGDGTPDDGRPAVPAVGAAETACADCVDDDGDGVADDGCAAIGVVGGTPESILVEEDDDESGFIDDIHGVDMEAAFQPPFTAGAGERAASTHPAVVIRGWHATLTASSFASQIDNAQELAGLNPRVRLLPIGMGGVADFVAAARYADARGARVVNMSWGFYCTCSSSPCTGAARTAYDQCVVAGERRFQDAFSPSMLYVNSAGNSRWDLTTDAVPDGAGNCPAGVCRWRFPQNVGTYLDAGGNLIAGGSGTPFNAVIAAINMQDRLVDVFLGGSPPGTNVGTIVGGGSAVDFGSLTEAVDMLNDTSNTGTQRTSGGTSYASPTAAGVASTVIAALPNTFDRRPALLLSHLRATLAPCQAPLGALRGCTGNMLSPGRVDLFNALNTPAPALSAWENESWRLTDNTLSLTHDVDFVDVDASGTVDMLFEVFGGPALEQVQPRVHWYDLGTGTFSNQTAGRLLSDVTGNYNKSAVGDLDGDNCADIVLAGFLSPAPAPDAFQGQANRMLLQNNSGACDGTFRDATNEMVGGVARLPTRGDITRDVDLFDMDGDSDLDILFTNATLAEPGGSFGDQLLRNDGGVFVDVSSQLPATTGDAHRASAMCFVNADAFVDIVQAATPTNRILINDGSGSFMEEGSTRGLPADTGFSHDVECQDFFLADGSLGQDGRPELVFARRNGLANLMYVSDAAGNYTDVSTRLGAFTDTTQEIEVCELDGVAPPEILVGNGDIVDFLSEPNRVLRYDAGSGNFIDASAALGFQFAPISDLTEDIECADMDGAGGIETVVVGNTGQRNWLYRRQ